MLGSRWRGVTVSGNYRASVVHSYPTPFPPISNTYKGRNPSLGVSFIHRTSLGTLKGRNPSLYVSFIHRTSLGTYKGRNPSLGVSFIHRTSLGNPFDYSATCTTTGIGVLISVRLARSFSYQKGPWLFCLGLQSERVSSRRK